MASQRCGMMLLPMLAAAQTCRPATCTMGEHCVPGAPSCQACPMGTYGTTAGPAPECITCSSGRYQSKVGQISCLQCPFGKAASRPPHQALSDCYDPAAAASPAPTPLACAAGEYFTTLHTGLDHCEQCPAGKHGAPRAGDNAVECTACATGRFADSPGSVACKRCPQGTTSTPAGASCAHATTTPAPTLSTTALVLTTAAQAACAAGYGLSSKGFGIDTCQVCGAGRFNPAAVAQRQRACVACPVSKYAVAPDPTSKSGNTACQACPGGRHTEDTGAASSSQCVPDETCPPGSIPQPHEPGYCIECKPGKYQRGATECATCPAGKFTSRAAQVQCLDHGHTTTAAAPQANSTTTAARTTAAATKAPQARPAETTAAQAACAAGYGLSSKGFGIDTCQVCGAGRFNPAAVAQRQRACVACPVSKYAVAPDPTSKSGNTACQACPGGRHTEDTGAASSSQCVPDETCPPGSIPQPHEPGYCIECKPGRYQRGATECAACPKGMWQPHAERVNVTSCLACPKGKYTLLSAQVRCLGQGITTHTPETSTAAHVSTTAGPAVCHEGGYGFSTENYGIEICQACEAGRFNAANVALRRHACVACPLSKYAGAPNPAFRLVNTACHACPAGRHTRAAGATSVDHCHGVTNTTKTTAAQTTLAAVPVRRTTASANMIKRPHGTTALVSTTKGAQGTTTHVGTTAPQTTRAHTTTAAVATTTPPRARTPAPTPTRVSAGGGKGDGSASQRSGGGVGAGSSGASGTSAPGAVSGATTAVAVAAGVVSVALAGWFFRARQRARADYTRVDQENQDQDHGDGSWDPDTIDRISDQSRDTATYGSAPPSGNGGIRDMIVSSHVDDGLDLGLDHDGDLPEDVV